MGKTLLMILVFAMVPVMGLQAKSVEQKLNSGALERSLIEKQEKHNEANGKVQEVSDLLAKNNNLGMLTLIIFQWATTQPGWVITKNQNGQQSVFDPGEIAYIANFGSNYMQYENSIKVAFEKASQKYKELLNEISVYKTVQNDPGQVQKSLEKMKMLRDEINAQENIYKEGLVNVYRKINAGLSLYEMVQQILPRSVYGLDANNKRATFLY